MRRLIDGPRRDWLSAEQVAAWLGIGETLFRALVDSGRFPAPVALGKGKPQKWNWLDAVAYMHLRGRSLAALDIPQNGAAEDETAAPNRRRPAAG